MNSQHKLSAKYSMLAIASMLCSICVHEKRDRAMQGNRQSYR
ncbi:hypothetical protein [Coleofasciculus chthonoplastes]